jgi:hypothetical protein
MAQTGAVALPVQPATVDLRVTSTFFPDKVFIGSAESIYNEMAAINPASVGNLTAIAEEKSVSSGLVKRATVSYSRTLPEGVN